MKGIGSHIRTGHLIYKISNVDNSGSTLRWSTKPILSLSLLSCTQFTRCWLVDDDGRETTCLFPFQGFDVDWQDNLQEPTSLHHSLVYHDDDHSCLTSQPWNVQAHRRPFEASVCLQWTVRKSTRGNCSRRPRTYLYSKSSWRISKQCTTHGHPTTSVFKLRLYFSSLRHANTASVLIR